MASPTGIIPEDMMFAARKADVIAFIQAAPAEADFKRKLLLGWAITVGVRLNKHDYEKVDRTGIDRP